MNKDQTLALSSLLVQMSREERLTLLFQLQYVERLNEVMDEFSLSEAELSKLLHIPVSRRKLLFTGVSPVTLKDVAALTVVTTALRKQRTDSASTEEAVSPSVSF